ncbi:SIMPL domain-containing protein [uncultured Cetobacterium sp.]|uniref:SIMPL domain-containing protein n=1 Tax=uncultured Cetobacterium sp. TaxID=527638 RepID=UPI002637B329|nr:SIMPL domain-containing protein [uncultured Cetobacterium sp.]
MKGKNQFLTLGLCILIGLSILGFTLGNSLVNMKSLDRTVVVKGLSEKEVMSDTVVWPISFKVTGNNLVDIYNQVEIDNKKINEFLMENGVSKNEITLSSPNIEDKMLYQYDNTKIPFRYIATQVITVYSHKTENIYKLSNKIGELVKMNIALNNNGNINYTYSDLSSIKPKMIEEATKNAREVAEKFAKDSNSSLGKIKRANQGQFIIYNRDNHNPQIKKVRVVSTIEYYLVD